MLGIHPSRPIELFAGDFRCNRPDRKGEKVTNFLLPFHLLPYDRDSAMKTAEIRYQLEKVGCKIAPYDLLLAGHALTLDLTLVTHNTRDQTLTRRSRILHSTPFAAAPLPRIRRAPSFLLSVNLSLAPANASFTNSLLPITAPSVKYLTRFLSMPAIPRSGKWGRSSVALSKYSASFIPAVAPLLLEV